MATLNIQGQKVKVDDAFLSMTPEQQNAAVEEIAKSLPAAAPLDSGAVGDANARAKAGIAKAQQILAGGGPKPEQGHEAPTFVPNPDMGATGTYLTSTGEGVPIAGPYIDKGLTAASAGIGSLLTDEPYSKVNAEMTRMNEASRDAHPVARTLGNVTGAVAGTLPAMMVAPEAFGIGAASVPAQALISGGTGGMINAADSAVRSGGDPRETFKGGLMGLGAGLAAPVVGPLIGKGVKAVADNLHIGAVARALGLDKRAVSVLVDAARQDAVEPAKLAQLGNNGMLMDLGPNMRHTAGAIAATPGEGKAIVRNAIGARDADANWRIRSALNQTLGEAPTPSRIIDRANTNQQRLAPEYREALRDAGPVDTLPIARYLETEAQTLRGEPQRLVQRVRSMLDYQPTPADIARARANGQPPPGTSLISDAGELLNTRHAIDDMLETTQGTNAVNALTTARQAVDDELRASVPGIKEVDAKYSELARQKEAVQRGQSVLSSGREAPRPDELAADVRQGALPQGLQVGPSAVPVRLREGARAEIERIVGTNANDRVALQRLIKGEGDWNRARLSTLFGSDKARSIIDLLDREKLFADTSNIVTRNSESAARIAAQDAITGETSRGFGVPEGFIAGGVRGAARAAGLRSAEKVVNALRNGGNDKAISQMATALASGQRSPVLAALMKAGQGSRLQQSQVDRIARALLLSSSERN
ncbi:hypothetical protein [Mesorhizobium ciceri]|uniref:Uncharacterized protein n=1 Tax=Mesorhizobium ciceri biovar biserrulae (strain HAMBI 2942 / LMG 23838 / WSM1271) TaxID=765698 RepID=E8T7S6_MESCW|nr:hypothetical protein [Mesorhizobium ciceri]ADV12927.1 hypothetical protein Mesci_3810 [Mesorhizobium ciceri biovar biserrulae WSM1271]